MCGLGRIYPALDAPDGGCHKPVTRRPGRCSAGPGSLLCSAPSGTAPRADCTGVEAHYHRQWQAWQVGRPRVVRPERLRNLKNATARLRCGVEGAPAGDAVIEREVVPTHCGKCRTQAAYSGGGALRSCPKQQCAHMRTARPRPRSFKGPRARKARASHVLGGRS